MVSAFFSTSTRSRTATAWPGHSLWSALANSALRRMVPVAASTWLSMTVSLPVASSVAPSEVRASTGVAPAASAAEIAGSSSCGAVKTTEIGSIWAMATMPVCCDALTMLPWSTSRKPTRPLIGADDPRVVELHLGGVDRRGVGRLLGDALVDLGVLGVELLLGGEALLGEGRDSARGRAATLASVAWSWACLALAWSSAAWNGARIDLRQQVAGLDHLAFLEGDLDDLAVDASAHRHRVLGLDLAERVDEDRIIGALDRRHRNGGRLQAAGWPEFGVGARLGGEDSRHGRVAPPARRRGTARPAKSGA